MFNRLLLSACGALVLSGQVFGATLTTYTDRTTFLNDLSGQLVTENFNSIGSDIDTLPGTPIDVGPFTLSAAGPSAGNIGIDFPSGDATSPGGFDRNVDGTTYLFGDVDNGQVITLTFDDMLEGIAFEGFSTQNAAVNIDIAGAVEVIPDDGFFGIISDMPFNQLTISGGDGAFGLDNFDLGLTPVPEPTSFAIWSLLGLVLAGFGYCRTRRMK